MEEIKWSREDMIIQQPSWRRCCCPGRQFEVEHKVCTNKLTKCSPGAVWFFSYSTLHVTNNRAYCAVNEGLMSLRFITVLILSCVLSLILSLRCFCLNDMRIMTRKCNAVTNGFLTMYRLLWCLSLSLSASLKSKWGETWALLMEYRSYCVWI